MDKNKDSILYVDDEKINLILFKETFSKNYNVFVSTSTLEARNLLADNEIKVVFSDLMMPDESGIDFITSISSVYPNITYIILTAYKDFDSAIKAINTECVDRYLLKPWNSNEILITIKNGIQSYDLKKQNQLLISELSNKNRDLVQTLNRLKERDEQFSKIFYETSDGIMIYRLDGEIIRTNKACDDFFNNGSSTTNLKDLLKGSNAAKFKRRMKEAALGRLPMTEYKIAQDNGTVKYFEANPAIINYSGEKVVLSLVRDITERKISENNVLNAVIQAEELERQRIAADLHDGLGPLLSTSSMYIERLQNKTDLVNEDQLLGLSFSTIKEAINQLRNISHNLSPHLLTRFGLTSALQSHIDMITLCAPTKFYLYSNLNDRIEKYTEISLYRILKECINNTIKYAQAQNGYITIEKQEDRLKIIYKDDGVGFDLQMLKTNSKGIGLYNAENRIKSLGGDIEFISSPNKGFCMRINISLI